MGGPLLEPVTLGGSGLAGRTGEREGVETRRKHKSGAQSATRATRRDRWNVRFIRENQHSPLARARVTGVDPGAQRCRGEDSRGHLENLAMEVECKEGTCDNRRLQLDDFIRTRVKELPGHPGHWGLFAVDGGAPGDYVVEYVGVGMRRRVFEDRFGDALREGKIERTYFAVLLEGARGVILDASDKGGKARYAQHSCEPNSRLKPVSVRGERRLVVEVISGIEAGGEVTFSYDFANS